MVSKSTCQTSISMSSLSQAMKPSTPPNSAAQNWEIATGPHRQALPTVERNRRELYPRRMTQRRMQDTSSAGILKNSVSLESTSGELRGIETRARNLGCRSVVASTSTVASHFKAAAPLSQTKRPVLKTYSATSKAIRKEELQYEAKSWELWVAFAAAVYIVFLCAATIVFIVVLMQRASREPAGNYLD